MIKPVKDRSKPHPNKETPLINKGKCKDSLSINYLHHNIYIITHETNFVNRQKVMPCMDNFVC